jgi:hypothetical protein
MRVSTTVPLATCLALMLAACGSSSKSASSSTAASSPSASGSAARSTTSSTPTSTTTSASAAGATGIVSGSASGITATMHAGTHNPRVNDLWPLSFSVSRGGSPVKASVNYEFLFAGQVVGRRSHYTFTGHFSDRDFLWPSAAVGYPLTFRAVIASGTSTINLDYPVQVIR